jgi:hypothetical protein
MKFDNKLRVWSNSEFCDLLSSPKQIRAFFDYLEDTERGFNGDLFPLSDIDYKKLSKEDCQVLRRLLQGVDIKKNQPSLFQLYDFSIIPIEFISNVYELFIGEENQREEGAYYTPLFLVDYILKETVDKHLYSIIDINTSKQGPITKPSSNYSYCKVLDPACGSGVFLVETLRKIIEKYIDETGIEIKSERFKTAIKNLAKENIFGIDKDESAVQVAIFSIYLTLLDYLDPPGIETFKFPILLNSNFFQGDFFDETNYFNEHLKNIQLDFILGNPPWGGNALKDIGKKYLERRQKVERKQNKKFEIAVNNNEIVEAFIFRVSDFCKQETTISFIVRSTILYNQGYNDGYSKFRQYWLEEFYIKRVFELAPVRHEVFDRSNDPSIAPAAVLFYSYANGHNTDENIVEHITLKPNNFFSLFKIFTINRSDYKKIQQKKLKDFDWLWKVLVYGSYLDFNFIKRIKEEFDTVKKVVSNEKSFVEATGLHSRSHPLKKPKDTSEIASLPFLRTEAVKSFWIDYKQTGILEKDKIDIVKDTRIYKNPMLLIREGIDMTNLTAKCSISYKDVIFKDSITSIKVLKKADLQFLYSIAAIFSSSLFSYYAVNTFASIGIERERVKNYNKYSLPFLELDIGDSIKLIEESLKNIHLEKQKDLYDNIKIQVLNNEVNSELKKIEVSIYKKLNLNDLELSLINYSLEINRKLIVGDDLSKRKLFAPLKIEDPILIEYANLFLERFKPRIDSEGKKFLVEIWHTDQIIAMFFRTVPEEQYTQEITWLNKQNRGNEILLLLARIGTEKITDNLFVQKDIRGFETDYFYIVKPNEKRLWHKAIGFLDVNEFANAILKAGRG